VKTLSNKAPLHKGVWESGVVAPPFLTSALYDSDGGINAPVVLYSLKNPEVNTG
jgi:hypothetical protein